MTDTADRGPQARPGRYGRVLRDPNRHQHITDSACSALRSAS